MDKELKTKWVTALKSGVFRKGEGMLHDPFTDAFCCLGVLQMLTDGKVSPIMDEYSEGEVEEELPTLDYLRNVGLTKTLACELADINDRTDDFSEVIKVIEEKT
jgi:hypothetical protein